jgi:hypothetical protein
MKWLEASKVGTGQRLFGPDKPAIAVRVYHSERDHHRVCLMLNQAFIKAARLQPGDRLAVGIDGEVIGLRRSERGNAISGGGFSISRSGKKSSDKATPYVSYNERTFPEVGEWAKSRARKWVFMTDKGTHWESIE